MVKVTPSKRLVITREECAPHVSAITVEPLLSGQSPNEGSFIVFVLPLLSGRYPHSRRFWYQGPSDQITSTTPRMHEYKFSNLSEGGS